MDKETEKTGGNKHKPRAMTIQQLVALQQLDEFLTNMGRDGTPVTVKEISRKLGYNNSKERGLRKYLDGLAYHSKESNSSFELTRIKKGRSIYYMIEPGHSLFRRDLNQAEKQLINDIFQTMGKFSVPSFSQIDDLQKEAESGTATYAASRKCVDFGIEEPSSTTHFSRLFDAIANRNVVELHYKPVRKLSDSTAEIAIIRFCPWQLKQIDGRWGIIGMDCRDGFILKFYLEQIQEITVLAETYDEKEMERMDGLFDDQVGMSTPDFLCKKNPEPESIKSPEDVYVWVDSAREQYLRSFPLHQSMDELDNDSEQVRLLREKYPALPQGGAIFWMTVHITHPLKQLLASYLNRMIVLEPESLRADMEERIGLMHSLYSSLSTNKE